MLISLIITTCNRKDALELSLLSVLNQSVLPNEIIIADDGSKDDTRDLIQKYQKIFTVPIIHSWQEDLGFRAAMCRNKAIIKVKSEYIILVDGDIILHRDFIKDHKEFSQKGFFVQGSRILLSKDKTEKVIKNKQLKILIFEQGLSNRHNRIHCKLLSRFIPQLQKLKNIKTCNFAFWKDDAIEVNGFNEDFIGWGREDSEFVVRLMNRGIKRKNFKFGGIAYHLWHRENFKSRLSENDNLLEKAIAEKSKFCTNGINKY